MIVHPHPECVYVLTTNLRGCLSSNQTQEKKSNDESRLAVELRKHYENVKGRSEKLSKDKS